MGFRLIVKQIATLAQLTTDWRRCDISPDDPLWPQLRLTTSAVSLERETVGDVFDVY